MIINLFLIKNIHFFTKTECCCFFCQWVKYEDQNYITCNSLISSTSQIADILSVIDEMIYAAALVFKILVIYRLDFYLKFAEKNLEL